MLGPSAIIPTGPPAEVNRPPRNWPKTKLNVSYHDQKPKRENECPSKSSWPSRPATRGDLCAILCCSQRTPLGYEHNDCLFERGRRFFIPVILEMSEAGGTEFTVQ